ncbi:MULTISPECIES: hypothetical protein [unclassified Pyramidobacter]|nr:hypothetical protein [Pyramidobacter sp. CG50-2]
MVKYSVEQVSPKAVQKHAEDLYRNGFFCCEAPMSAPSLSGLGLRRF